MQLSAEARRCLLTLPASGGVSASTRMVARTCSAALLGSSSSYSYEEEREGEMFAHRPSRRGAFVSIEKCGGVR